MKSIGPALLAFLCCATTARIASAQDDDRPTSPTLPVVTMPEHDAEAGYGDLLDQRLITGGYGAPEAKLSTLAGNAVLLLGGQAGWILGRSVFVGGAGYASVTDVLSPRSMQSTHGNARLGISYGGLRMGAILASERRVHATCGLLIGGGIAASEDSLFFRRSDDFVVIEPDVEAEVNLTRHVRFALGGGYRVIGSTAEPGFTPQRLSGPTAMMTVRVGEF